MRDLASIQTGQNFALRCKSAAQPDTPAASAPSRQPADEYSPTAEAAVPRHWARSPPPAPRRHSRPLPPPPDVPEAVLAALRPRSGRRTAGADGDDQEVSSPVPPGMGIAGSDGTLHPALQQAHAWLAEIARNRQSVPR